MRYSNWQNLVKSATTFQLQTKTPQKPRKNLAKISQKSFMSDFLSRQFFGQKLCKALTKY